MQGTHVTNRVLDGVLRIELSSKNGMNLLGVETRRNISDVLKSHETDVGVCCVVVSSLGRAFSAGANLNQMVRLGKKEALAYSEFVRSFLAYVESYPKPTIGLVDGFAVGGGLELLMTLDIVLATPRSNFGQTELNVGLIPGGGGTQRLPRIVGVRKAKEMIYTGELISAAEALNWGLVTRVVEPDRLEAEALDIIRKLKSQNPKNLTLAKRAVNEGSALGFKAGLDMESRLYSQVLGSQEAKRDITNFLRKRSAETSQND